MEITLILKKIESLKVECPNLNRYSIALLTNLQEIFLGNRPAPPSWVKMEQDLWIAYIKEKGDSFISNNVVVDHLHAIGLHKRLGINSLVEGGLFMVWPKSSTDREVTFVSSKWVYVSMTTRRWR